MAAPIKSGAQVNAANDEGKSPPIIACIEGNLRLLNGNSPLHYAAASGNKFLGMALIDKNTDINFQNKDCESALIVAAIRRQNDFSAMLIEKGADVNQTDNLEHSAMHYASGGGYTEIVEQLIIAGAKN